MAPCEADRRPDDHNILALLRALSASTDAKPTDAVAARSEVLADLASGLGAERAILWSFDESRRIAVVISDSRLPLPDDHIGPDDHVQLTIEQLAAIRGLPARSNLQLALDAGLVAAELSTTARSSSPTVAIAPLVREGALFAALMVISPDESIPSADVDDVLSITVRHAANHLLHLRSTLRMSRRIELEQLTRSLGEQMIATPLDRLSAALNEAIRRIAEFVRLDAALLWRLDGRTFHRVAGWDRRGQVATSDSFEMTEQRAAAAASVTEPFPLDLADLDNAEQLGFGSYPNGSMLSIPVQSGSRGGTHLLSFVHFENRHWSKETTGLLSTAIDIFSQTLSRMTAEQLFSIAFETAPTGMTIRTVNRELIACNSAYEDFVGMTEAELLGSTNPQTQEKPTEVVPGAVRDRALYYEFEDGRSAWARVRQRKAVTADGSEILISHITDVTAEREAQDELEYQATHDALTGLPNRRALNAQLAEITDECAVLLLDLDRFKIINDSLGHGSGDDLLVAIADRLRLGVRPNDLVVRLGGDEFAVLMAGPVSEFEATVVGQRLLDSLGAPVQLGDYEVFPGASIGVAAGTADEVENGDLIRQADTAMYAAKSAGRNRLEVFTEEMGAAADERLRLDTELRGAADRGEFRLHYQPEVDLETGNRIGAEALIRWAHPTGELLLPGDFIPRAEETGMISDIGDWVLDEACAQMARWSEGTRPAPQQMRINISAAQLIAPTIVERVNSALNTFGLKPGQVCLEITESVLMANVTLSVQRLSALRELGVSLAIDDFGTGFSSLAYLQRFPVDVLKIDRSFVSALSRAEDSSRAIVRSILQLAEAFEMDVVAEGIETEQQASILSELGCRRAQGFWFARPAPASEINASKQVRTA